MEDVARAVPVSARPRRPHVRFAADGAVVESPGRPQWRIRYTTAWLILAYALLGVAIHFVAVAHGVPTPPGQVLALLVGVADLVVVSTHEVGHVVAARAVAGLRLTHVKIGAFGAAVGFDGACAYRSQLWVSLCGPFAGLVASAVLWLAARPAHSPTVSFVALFVATDQLLNLLPVRRGADGGRAVRCVWALLRGRGDDACTG